MYMLRNVSMCLCVLLVTHLVAMAAAGHHTTYQRKFRSLYFRYPELWKSLQWWSQQRLSLQWWSMQWWSLQQLSFIFRSWALSFEGKSRTKASFSFWERSSTKASFPYLQLAVFEGSLSRKLRFHIFDLQPLKEVSHKNVVSTSSTFTFWGKARTKRVLGR